MYSFNILQTIQGFLKVSVLTHYSCRKLVSLWNTVFERKWKLNVTNTKCVFFTGGGIKGTADQMLAHSWFNSYEHKLIAIFYYRDKTRVQMFYFFSENYGWLQWNIGNLDKWCKLFSLKILFSLGWMVSLYKIVFFLIVREVTLP